jgi:hypothetical protein
MNIFAVAPVINVDEWLTFCREAAEGDQADAHRQFLRRGGVTREHIFLQRTPAGALMLLVWGCLAAAAGRLHGESPGRPSERT